MKFLSKDQFVSMCQKQDELNCLINPRWKQAGYDWNLYIKDEVMEFFSYIGFKHWKEPDVARSPSDKQARLEVVDIWHFLLSKIIDNNSDVNYYNLYDQIITCTNFEVSANKAEMKYSIKTLDCYLLSTFRKLEKLTDMLAFCNWSWQELLETYTQKYVLNKFRQDHGYKDGSYVKTWDIPGTDDEGHKSHLILEDNGWLEHAVNCLLSDNQDVTDETLLYNKLETWYDLRVNK